MPLDLQSQQVLEEARNSYAIMGVIELVFNEKSSDERDRASDAVLADDPHWAVVHAARARAFSEVRSILADYGKET